MVITSLLLTYLSFIIVGLFLGILSSFFGIGGGIIIVPVLYFLYPNLPPQTVIGISLASTFLNSSLNSWNYYRQDHILHLKPAIFLGLGSSTGLIITSRLSFMIEPANIRLFFGLVLLTIFFYQSQSLIFSSRQSHSVQPRPFSIKYHTSFSALGGFLLGLMSGGISGLTGLGGGIIIVPFLLSLFKLSPPWPAIYSNFAMIFGSAPGLILLALKTGSPEGIPSGIAPFQFGYLNLLPPVLFFIGAVVTSRYGTRLAGRISPTKSKIMLLILLLFFSAKILIPTILS